MQNFRRIPTVFLFFCKFACNRRATVGGERDEDQKETCTFLAGVLYLLSVLRFNIKCKLSLLHRDSHSSDGSREWGDSSLN